MLVIIGSVRLAAPWTVAGLASNTEDDNARDYVARVLSGERRRLGL